MLNCPPLRNNQHYKNIEDEKETNLFKVILRTLFLGVGLGIISGTLLKAINSDIIEQNPANISPLFNNREKALISSKSNAKRNNYAYISRLIKSRSEDKLNLLSSKWEKLLEEKNDLEASAFMFLIDSRKYASLYPNQILPAASSIKIAILLITLEMIDSGEMKWNEKLVLTKNLIGGGAGWMGYQTIGKAFPVYEAATEMIRISDNTATNLLINRLGGKSYINQRFKQIGLVSTKLNSLLPDLEGTNKTTAKDLALTIALADSGNLLSQRSRDLFREILATSKSNRLLPGGLLEGLGQKSKDPDYNLMIKGYKVYNKTGDIGIAYADAGLIQLPNNTRAVAGFLVKGPFNDPRSSQLIRDMASTMAPFLTPN